MHRIDRAMRVPLGQIELAAFESRTLVRRTQPPPRLRSAQRGKLAQELGPAARYHFGLLTRIVGEKNKGAEAANSCP